MRYWLAGLAAVVMICSCGGGKTSMLPKSGGQPYEVLVVSGSDMAAAQAVDSVLSRDVEGLPQPEPMFDVSLTDSVHFNQMARLARNIIIININSDLFTETRVRYEKNVWAQPQMVVYVNAPSRQELAARLPVISKGLMNLLIRSELNAEISVLNAATVNADAEKAVRTMFGCRIMPPADMSSDKKGNGFLWLSDNGTDAMQNICIYSYAGDSFSQKRSLAVRDSVMRINIPGERQGMYMQTASGSVTTGVTEERGRKIMITRGLWVMKGDAMGGPFVSHSIIDTPRHRVIVAEAFVYAPGMKKRNMLRRLEAALYTLRLND